MRSYESGWVFIGRFLARVLHVAELQIAVHVIEEGSVGVLEPFVEIDEGMVGIFHEEFGTSFTVLFGVVKEKEMHLPIAESLIEKRRVW